MSGGKGGQEKTVKTRWITALWMPWIQYSTGGGGVEPLTNEGVDPVVIGDDGVVSSRIFGAATLGARPLALHDLAARPEVGERGFPLFPEVAGGSVEVS
jgi:hypothetical protein